MEKLRQWGSWLLNFKVFSVPYGWLSWVFREVISVGRCLWKKFRANWLGVSFTVGIFLLFASIEFYPGIWAGFNDSGALAWKAVQREPLFLP